MKKTLKTVAALLSLALCAVSAGFPCVADDGKALTLMIYMCGSNLESQYGSASADLDEMLAAGLDSRAANVLVMTGGTRYWFDGQDADHLEIRRVRGSQLMSDWSGPVRSMGEADTLRFFLDYAAENHPADRYALILWDHGGGPMEGLCWDELYDPDRLTVDELVDALSRSAFAERKLEWIGFDACLMSTVEVAYACAPYAKYMIASQETEPGTGWSYSFLGRVADAPDGEATGRLIVGDYIDRSAGDNQMLTLSCVDLARLSDVGSAMNALFERLDALLSQERFSEISNARRDAKSFGRASTGSEYDLVDLYSLSEQYASADPDGAAGLQTALERAIVCQAGNQANSHGLSVYYPYYNKEYYQKQWSRQYGALDFVEGYSGFMDHYADIWLGNPLADWSGVEAKALTPTPRRQELTLSLTPQQVENFAFAQVFILGKLPFSKPYYYKIDEIDDVALDDAGTLHADYNYKALYAVDGDGNPLCDAIPYRIVDGYYLIRANLTDKTWDEYWAEMDSRNSEVSRDVNMEARKVYLQCLPNAAGDGLDIVGVIDMGGGIEGLLSEGEGLYMGKQSIPPDMAAWKWVWFFHFPRALQRGYGDSLLPFGEWPNPNTDRSVSLDWDEIDNTAPWSLKFIEQQYTGRDLYAQYILHDTQGNQAGSNLIPVANPNQVHVATLNETVFESDRFTLTARSIDLAKAEFNGGLYLHFDLVDRGGEPGQALVYADNVLLDRCALNARYSLRAMPGQDGGTDYALFIPSEDLPEGLEERLTGLRFDATIREPGSGEDLAAFPVALSADIDLSPIHTCAPEQRVLAQAQTGGMVYQLLEMEEEDDCLALTLRVENKGAETVVRTVGSAAAVNGCLWEAAVDAPPCRLPGGCWTIQRVRVYELSPAEDSYLNPWHIPQYSYPAYWGTDAVERIEFTGWDDGTLRFDLDAPLALKRDDSKTAPASGALTLLDNGDITATAAGFAARDGALGVIVDVASHADRAVRLLPQYAAVNGAARKCRIVSFDDLSRAAGPWEELPAGQRRRVLFRFDPGDADAEDLRLDSVSLGFEYQPEGDPIWRYCSPATLGFDGQPALSALDGGALSTSNVAVRAGSALMDNVPVDPMSLADVTWDAPAGDLATVLRAPLTPEQAADFESATVKLLYPWSPAKPDRDEAATLITELDAPVLLEDGQLACDFSGLLFRVRGVEMPLSQRYTATEDGYTYTVGMVSLFSDHPINDLSLDAVRVRVRPADGLAALDDVRLTRAVNRAEALTGLKCWAGLFTFPDGADGAPEETQAGVGQMCPSFDGAAHLELCPAGSVDPIVMFCVQNRDGSAYTIRAAYPPSPAD